MLILKGKNSNGIVGRYKSIIDARKIFSDAQKYLAQNLIDQELVLVEGDHVVMTCMLKMFKNHSSLSPTNLDLYGIEAHVN
ncbi:hypothetical protein [Desulfosporosinus metallidurans]|uniref:Uncharacterized protein n=1 Tax=Desulfosporosinus metallidurans TaxID=1888891 RepID=A0A1Q8QN67_9FIRM|nr:hypothetical protein [Desulfosporosinus metallidurans]OLN28789.1 hypothetical protein DSOL_3866 [Desulfosporosinus metallidurans]